jgi:hypothetical protein
LKVKDELGPEARERRNVRASQDQQGPGCGAAGRMHRFGGKTFDDFSYLRTKRPKLARPDVG